MMPEEGSVGVSKAHTVLLMLVFTVGLFARIAGIVVARLRGGKGNGDRQRGLRLRDA